MKVVALVSGGKDSCYNMMQCVADGHEIIALANLKPAEDEVDSYMYQSVGHNVLDLYASAMDLPLFRADIKGKALNQNFDYLPTEGDEVEDLYRLLVEIKKSHDFEAISVGAIFSDYQRLRVENVCNRLELKMLAYLWHREQAELLKEMIDCKIHAIIIKVAALGLDINKHLGMAIEEIYPHMLEMQLSQNYYESHDQKSVNLTGTVKLDGYHCLVGLLRVGPDTRLLPLLIQNKKFGLNVCGEGGEFETLTLDCPLFKKKLAVKEKEIVVHSDDAFAPVGYLKISDVVLEEKKMDNTISQKECIKGLPIKLPSCTMEKPTTNECDMKYVEIKV